MTHKCETNDGRERPQETQPDFRGMSEQNQPSQKGVFEFCYRRFDHICEANDGREQNQGQQKQKSVRQMTVANKLVLSRTLLVSGWWYVSDTAFPSLYDVRAILLPLLYAQQGQSDIAIVPSEILKFYGKGSGGSSFDWLESSLSRWQEANVIRFSWNRGGRKPIEVQFNRQFLVDSYQGEKKPMRITTQVYQITPFRARLCEALWNKFGGKTTWPVGIEVLADRLQHKGRLVDLVAKITREIGNISHLMDVVMTEKVGKIGKDRVFYFVLRKSAFEFQTSLFSQEALAPEMGAGFSIAQDQQETQQESSPAAGASTLQPTEAGEIIPSFPGAQCADTEPLKPAEITPIGGLSSIHPPPQAINPHTGNPMDTDTLRIMFGGTRPARTKKRDSISRICSATYYNEKEHGEEPANFADILAGMIKQTKQAAEPPYPDDPADKVIEDPQADCDSKVQAIRDKYAQNKKQRPALIARYRAALAEIDKDYAPKDVEGLLRLIPGTLSAEFIELMVAWADERSVEYVLWKVLYCKYEKKPDAWYTYLRAMYKDEAGGGDPWGSKWIRQTQDQLALVRSRLAEMEAEHKKDMADEQDRQQKIVDAQTAKGWDEFLQDAAAIKIDYAATWETAAQEAQSEFCRHHGLAPGQLSEMGDTTRAVLDSQTRGKWFAAVVEQINAANGNSYRRETLAMNRPRVAQFCTDYKGKALESEVM